jgi:V/A-type H+/Na+-transporting ATPase subunit F
VPAGKVEGGKPPAVIGERELVIGFRLIGFKETVLVDDKNAGHEFQTLFESGEHSLILASRRIQNVLPEALRHAAEHSIDPLVVFLPTPGAGEEPESVAALTKRVLGVSLESLAAP